MSEDAFVKGLEKAADTLLYNILRDPSMEFYLASILDVMLFLQENSSAKFGVKVTKWYAYGTLFTWHRAEDSRGFLLVRYLPIMDTQSKVYFLHLSQDLREAEAEKKIGEQSL